jgi:hypothetical protein
MPEALRPLPSIRSAPQDIKRTSKDYDSQGRLVSYKETGVIEGQSYQMQRKDITYDAEGNVTGFKEAGVIGDKIYRLDKQGLDYARGEKLNEFSEGGNYAGVKYEVKMSDISMESSSRPGKPREKEEFLESQRVQQKARISQVKQKAISVFKFFLASASFLIVLFLIILFLTKLIRYQLEKQRLQFLAVNNPREFIVKLYHICLGVLAICGRGRPAWMTPGEFLEIIRDEWRQIEESFQGITEMFIEARYSQHPITQSASCGALSSYYNIIEKAEAVLRGWPRLALSFRRFNLSLPTEPF